MTDDLSDHQLRAHEIPTKLDKDGKHCLEAGTAVYVSLANLLEAADILEKVLGNIN